MLPKLTWTAVVGGGRTGDRLVRANALAERLQLPGEVPRPEVDVDTRVPQPLDAEIADAPLLGDPASGGGQRQRGQVSHFNFFRTARLIVIRCSFR